MERVKRRYHAPVREQQAAQTRERIAAAAIEEFTARGWAGTTVAAVAARAGVTAQAVYQAVGAKPDLLIRAVETAVAGAADDVMLADRATFAAAFVPSLSATRRIRAFAEATAQAYARSAVLFLVLQDAARSDPTAEQMAAAGAERRLTETRRFAALLLPEEAGADVDALADAVWVLTGPSVYADLVNRRGWDPARYRTFLETAIAAATRRVDTMVGSESPPD